MSLIERLQQMAVDPYHGEITTDDCKKILMLLSAAEGARKVLANVSTRLCLTDPDDLVKLGGQGPPWTLWTLAESLEDYIGPIDAVVRLMEKP